MGARNKGSADEHQCQYVCEVRLPGKRYVLSRDRCRRRVKASAKRCWQHRQTSL